ncbi:urokinase plasminogen activator surface receptor-like isoform X1 [Astyanax mexicanus]|uniref:Urokinase plasminogen activator surface receptor-like isoform X1 n=1 Tax=Astyanax mexicanus TaxID=7994 RepID=A0A8T2LH67_ASTMX|nr:urokinase plasminogen activator surface receptor-like isoform X1 [Astyanax mexicanus]
MCFYFTNSCAVFTAGLKQDVQMKKCATSPECVSGSMNLGAVKMSLNTKCCSTDFCNSQSVPGSPNGRKCYTCDNNDCTGIVDCEGDEDHCINIKSEKERNCCVSRSMCTGQASMPTAGVSGSLSCCQGNLCNGAESMISVQSSLHSPLKCSLVFFLLDGHA